MKGFLFDQNLPDRITFKPSLTVRHVSEIGASPTDSEVWELAKKMNWS
jgi:predicted nuclease of predicted toxin-antitoxin system